MLGKKDFRKVLFSATNKTTKFESVLHINYFQGSSEEIHKSYLELKQSTKIHLQRVFVGAGLSRSRVSQNYETTSKFTWVDFQRY